MAITPNYYGGNGQVVGGSTMQSWNIDPYGNMTDATQEGVPNIGNVNSNFLQADAAEAQKAYAATAGKIDQNGQLIPGYYPQTKAEWTALGRHASEMGAQKQAGLYQQQAGLYGYGGGSTNGQYNPNSGGGGGGGGGSGGYAGSVGGVGVNINSYTDNGGTGHGQFVPSGNGGMAWQPTPKGGHATPQLATVQPQPGATSVPAQPGQVASGGQQAPGQLDQSLYDPWKAALLKTIQSGGIDSRTEQDMVNRQNEGVSIAQADALRNQTAQAGAAGFANSGDAMRGQQQIESQAAGQKAANARDTHIGVAGQNQQTRLQAMGQAGSFLSQQQANQHADKMAFGNLLNQQANQQNVPDTSNKGFAPPGGNYSFAPPGGSGYEGTSNSNPFGDFLASLNGGKTKPTLGGKNASPAFQVA